MPFAFSKILDHGVSHPVIARMQLQVGELLRNTSFNEEARQGIFQASFDASLRLVRCGDIQHQLMEKLKQCDQEYGPNQNSQAVTLPHAIGLQHDAEAFLYEAKNFLRDLTSILNAAFGTAFNEASQFCDLKNNGNGEIARWATGQFGTDERLSQFFRMHQPWVTEVIRMRNAIEHPGGHSGVLHIRNYELIQDGSIRRPVWYRNEESPSSLIDEMAGLCDQMLEMGDELIALIVQRHLAVPILQVYSIPEEQRNPSCPKSFMIGMTEAAARQFQKQTESGS